VIGTDLMLAVERLASDTSATFIHDFLERMGEDYCARFSPEQIATHVQLSSTLGPERRVRVRIRHEDDGEFDIVIVGFDYLSQFSIVCGLLSAFALDIRTGDIYSFANWAERPSSSRIVDVFRVALLPGEIFDETRQREFEHELGVSADLLAANSINEARERLNRFLTERIEKMEEPLSGLLSPVALHFDNAVSPDWTVMDTQTEDSFGFLYAISNALSMRGVYISRVRIRSRGRIAHDQFFIGDRWGRKIKEGREQQRLQLTVSMIKEFTRFLTEAPDPAKAMRHFDQFLDRIVRDGDDKFPDEMVEILASSYGMTMLAHLLGSSDHLWNDFLRLPFAEVLPVLESFGGMKDEPGTQAHFGKDGLRKELSAWFEREGAPTFPAGVSERKEILNSFKDRQLFLIEVRHLLAPTMMDFSMSLTNLAEVVIEEAARVCYSQLVLRHREPRRADGSAPSFAICALGKFGGREMGYASDLELLFVHEGGSSEFFESFASRVVDFIETPIKGIFQIDLRLRPHGEAGPKSTTFEQFQRYYSLHGGAAPFERQALIKLRAFAGDPQLGRRVEAHRDKFTYSDARWNWEDALLLRRRQMAELVKPGQVNVKYSAGGLVDIEYAIQYLQLLNGAEHPEVRVPTTLEALRCLRRLQIVREPDYEILNSGYLFLRNVIDALRIVRGHASDLVLPPEDSEEFKSLARRLGYRHKDRAKGALLLATDIKQAMSRVHRYFIARFDALTEIP
jgi:[glutamine synthetase] adenylyltransferase / [glutamine synthetase]-adenylyl-L-tyrosine phosphorylase